jgi:hypothetical protein
MIAAFFRSAAPPPPRAPRALDIMRRLNRHAIWSREGGREVFIEDHRDPDGRWYRLEYQSDSQGRNAVAYCRYNPWGTNTYGVHQSHLFPDGRICLGNGEFNLEAAVQRARFWCTAYSYLREHGTFPG